ncbi:MAG: hypothetical protein CMP08_07885 [Xanthomonadales bacterium]|nr:hypothetical protein [Xanthomonadales bacterium]
MNACRRAQQGFSLVELMVTLAVGLFLLVGVLQILQANRESFEAQRGTAHLEENARLAVFVLEHGVAHAGYHVTLDSNPFQASNALAPALAQGAVIGGQANIHNNNDQLRIRFQAAGGVKNCRGQDIGTPGAPAMADFEFYVSDADALICHQAGSDRQPVIDNVDRFEVRYGIAGPNRADGVQYYTAQPSADARTHIKSVRIQLLLHSDPESGDRALPVPTTQRYNLMDGSVFEITDRRARLLIDRMIALKNRLP